MPTFVVTTRHLDAETKHNLENEVSKLMEKYFSGHNCDLFLSEYSGHTYNGNICDAAEIELIAAMEISEEKMSRITKDLCEVVRKSLSLESLRIIFSYIKRNQSYLGVNGEILTEIYKKDNIKG